MKYEKITVIGDTTTTDKYEGTAQEINKLIELECGECEPIPIEINASKLAKESTATIRKNEMIKPLR